MVEPTESESLSELDRFCEALISIRKELMRSRKAKQIRRQCVEECPHTARTVSPTTGNTVTPGKSGLPFKMGKGLQILAKRKPRG